MTDLISIQTLPECVFSVTSFDGFFNTSPVNEAVDVSWLEIVASTAPKNDCALVKEKERAPYFVPCALHDAPYTGKTLERAQREVWPSLVGKQRSGAHCGASAILKYDLDGMSPEQWVEVLGNLKNSGLTFLAYSTHSFGLKPGVRVRVLIPLDKELVQSDYESAWWGAAEVLFPELIGHTENILDPSASKIHQQQSVWCASPDREDLAFRHSGVAGVASADVLMTASTKRKSKVTNSSKYSASLNSDLMLLPDVARLTAAHDWIDANSHDSWMKVGHCYKALARIFSEEAAFNLWVDFGDRGTNTAKNDAEYAPGKKWETFSPSMNSDIALGTLFGMARDGARNALEAERGKAVLSERGRAAAKYLRVHHRSLFNELNGGAS